MRIEFVFCWAEAVDWIKGFPKVTSEPVLKEVKGKPWG